MAGFIEDYFFNLFVRVNIDLDYSIRDHDAILKDIFDLPIRFDHRIKIYYFYGSLEK